VDTGWVNSASGIVIMIGGYSRVSRIGTSGSCPTPICPRVRGQATPVVLQPEPSICCSHRAGSSTRGVRVGARLSVQIRMP
jgi:hypothetical protein